MVENVISDTERAKASEGQGFASDVVAIIAGENFTALPEDLYIPPEALLVFLEAFEGPLDLLLYLIKKNNIDILNIPIAAITRQYMQYVDMMQKLKLDLAAEYLLMAATLAEIKSRMLLPRSSTSEDTEVDDPRAELVRKLQEYESIKKAAVAIDHLDRVERDWQEVHVELPEFDFPVPEPDVDFDSLIGAFRRVMQRASLFSHHEIEKEPLSIRERMSEILDKLAGDGHRTFCSLFSYKEGRMGVAVSFIAILELTRQSLISLVQNEEFAQIYVKRRIEEKV